jgi:replicative DNA helicase
MWLTMTDMASKGSRTVYACQSCGHQSRKWLGKCPDCGGWNTFAEERERAAPKEGAHGPRAGLRLRESKPVPFTEIEAQDDSREITGIEEFDRVLGGGIVPGSLVLIGGEPGIGKCLAGSTRIFDPVSGAFSEITQYANAPRAVLSLDTLTHRLTPQLDTRFLDQGVQPVVEMATRLGRKLRCTPSHPLLTPEGWRAVGELRPGTRVAAPLAAPYFGQAEMSESAIKMIAESLGSRGARASQKAVPDCVFRLPRPQLAMFLKALFSCGGSIYVSADKQVGVSYSTASRRLAEDAQHLLLRFGLVARLRSKRRRGDGQDHQSWEIQLLGAVSVNRFLEEIGVWGREAAKEKLAAISEPKHSSTHFNTIPTGTLFWRHLRAAAPGLSFKRIAEHAGVNLHPSRCLLGRDRKRHSGGRGAGLRFVCAAAFEFRRERPDRS